MSDAKPHKSAESIVWKQFQKRRSGVLSLYVVFCLFAVAIYAPLLANNNPLALKTTYAVLYEYYWAGWQTVSDATAKAVADLDALKAQEAEAVRAYEAEREALKGLTERYNDVGNRYDQARDRANRLEDQIEALNHEKELAKAAGQPTDAIDAKLLALEPERTDVQEERKRVGGEQSQVKREIDERRARQTLANDDIVRIRFQTAFDKHRSAVLLNIDRMTNYVEPEIAEKLSVLGSAYEAAYDQLIAGGDATLIAADLQKLQAEAHASVSPEAAAPHLASRWIFPVLAQMDLIDRLFAFGYPVLLLALILGDSLRMSVGRRIALSVAVGLALGAVTPLFSWSIPPRNYQNLLLENVAAGIEGTLAVMPPVPFGMNENRFEEGYHKPSFVMGEAGIRSRHLLGTDDTGRDVLARMIWGARVSLSVGFVAVGLYLTIGIIIGALAGYFGGAVDLVLSRIIEIVICFPSLFLILTVIAFIGPSIYNVMIVIGLTGWTGIARLTRAEFLRLRGQDFVIAARATGSSGAAVMFRHILPNALTPVLVSAAFGFAGSILLESGLSFLGFGVQEPFPSWGQMLASGRANPLLYWWLFIVPGIALFLTVTVYNLVGNAFRDASDPRLRK